MLSDTYKRVRVFDILYRLSKILDENYKYHLFYTKIICIYGIELYM